MMTCTLIILKIQIHQRVISLKETLVNDILIFIILLLIKKQFNQILNNQLHSRTKLQK